MSKKIIVAIDDNQSILESIEKTLKVLNPGWKILTFNNPVEGIEYVKNNDVNLVLLDIMMPEMDGWSVAATIREDPKTKDVPIVFLTAKTDDLSKNLGTLSSQDFIEKPFDIEDLNARVKKVMKN